MARGTGTELIQVTVIYYTQIGFSSLCLLHTLLLNLVWYAVFCPAVLSGMSAYLWTQ